MTRHGKIDLDELELLTIASKNRLVCEEINEIEEGKEERHVRNVGVSCRVESGPYKDAGPGFPGFPASAKDIVDISGKATNFNSVTVKGSSMVRHVPQGSGISYIMPEGSVMKCVKIDEFAFMETDPSEVAPYTGSRLECTVQKS